MCSGPSVQGLVTAIWVPAATCWPTVTEPGVTCRNTHTLPSAPCSFTVPPKIWPEVPRDARTSTIVPANGARIGAFSSVKKSYAAW
nr:hypothetical protein [Miltoncostaea oceani]